jgi:hypothetical protein
MFVAPKTDVLREARLVNCSGVLPLRVPHVVEHVVDRLGRCPARERNNAGRLREGRAELAVRRVRVVDRALLHKPVARGVIDRGWNGQWAGVDDDG